MRPLIKHFRKILIVAGTVCVVFSGTGQSLTLDSCLKAAGARNLTLENARLDVLAAEQVKRQAFTKYFPTVSATALGYRALNPMFEYGIGDIDNAQVRQDLYNLWAEYGGSIGIPPSISLAEKGTTVAATAMQPLYAGGRIVNGNRLAQLGVEAAQLQQELSQEKVLLSVEESYWLVVSLYEKRHTVLQALDFLDTLGRDVLTAEEAGLITRNDRLKVALKRDEMRSNLLKVENGIQLATMALCQLSGIEYSPTLRLTDTVATEPSDIDVRIAEAVARRKESRLLALNVQAEQLKKKMIVGEALPQLAIGVGASYGNLIVDRHSANGLAFATLQVPLTDWWATTHKAKEQEIRIQQAENSSRDLTEKMALETEQAIHNVQEAQAQVALAESTLYDAKENLENVLTNYEAGLVPVSELLEARTLYSQAQDQFTEARIDLTLKCARLKLIQ
ncbi:MAG: TolC family protein [Bacteroidales bacterium]|nr:TolC family protein [Bacteroidales bacterium]